ncbi:MAG: FecR domain-containing protein [Proteobacteria bacterium]|nr:FecR domain-containing protein [Pseudomonadota bacterium]
MKRVLAILGAVLLSAAAGQAQAAPAAVVDGVQMPAWVERAGVGAARRLPIAPGMELRGGDEVRTGAGSRVYIRLAEGSLVKLGENASLRIIDIAPDRGGFFMAALNVLEGAFRFTTDLLARERRRDVSIRIATVTAGIRGTDLWGKSSPERQVVCLIDGKIEVGGKWKVTLASADTQGAALEVYDRLRSAGYAAEIYPTKSGAQRVYLVRISRLPSKADAEALAEQLRGTAGVEDPKVSS